MRFQSQMLAFGVRRAEAGEVHARVALHRGAQALRIGRIHGGSKEFQVAVLEHHADVRGARRPVLRLLRRGRRDDEAERLQRPRRGAQIRNEVRDMVQDQLAGDGYARGHVL